MYTLYNVKNWGSLAPHMVLEELEIPYQNAWMTPEEVRRPAFREISPLGLIPAMRFDDGYIMVELAAIVAFLTASYPEAGLQPEVGSSEHAAYLSWLSFLSANLYPAMSSRAASRSPRRQRRRAPLAVGKRARQGR